MLRRPAVPYVAPFVVFLLMLGLGGRLGFPEPAGQAIWLLAPGLALWFVSRPVLDLRLAQPLASAALGVAMFVVWVAADAFIPDYRRHWLFENALTGVARTSLGAEALASKAVIVLRVARAVVVVPVLEELFWRGWLMRWLVKADFRSVPLGAYTAQSFWIVAVLFASEHGPYWDVGLAAGIAFNWWMIRTRSLGDLVLAHAVTNACLCTYVLASGKWEYWL